MVNSKILLTLIGLVVAVLAVCNIDFSEPVVENWWGGTQFSVKAMPAAKVNGKDVAIGGNFLNPNMMGSGKFVQVPNYQGILSPRFSNVNYGANIRYNMPDRKNMASPCQPLTFGEMAKEGYKENFKTTQEPVKENYGCGRGGGCGGNPPSCGKGGYGLGNKVGGGNKLPPGYANGNYWDVYNKLPYDIQSPMGSDLPIGTMTTMDSSGAVEQMVPFNRMMVANLKKSKLRAQGDPIRGDLAITPCQTGWFSVYPNINLDLQEGAMNVMGGGVDNSSYNNLMELMVQASGGAETTFGGVNLTDSLTSQNINMSTQSTTSLQSALGDINVTAFP